MPRCCRDKIKIYTHPSQPASMTGRCGTLKMSLSTTVSITREPLVRCLPYVCRLNFQTHSISARITMDPRTFWSSGRSPRSTACLLSLEDDCGILVVAAATKLATWTQKVCGKGNGQGPRRRGLNFRAEAPA